MSGIFGVLRRNSVLVGNIALVLVIVLNIAFA